MFVLDVVQPSSNLWVSKSEGEWVFVVTITIGICKKWWWKPPGKFHMDHKKEASTQKGHFSRSKL